MLAASSFTLLVVASNGEHGLKLTAPAPGLFVDEHARHHANTPHASDRRICTS
jgi:hypothetical protein